MDTPYCTIPQTIEPRTAVLMYTAVVYLLCTYTDSPRVAALLPEFLINSRIGHDVRTVDSRTKHGHYAHACMRYETFIPGIICTRCLSLSLDTHTPNFSMWRKSETYFFDEKEQKSERGATGRNSNHKIIR